MLLLKIETSKRNKNLPKPHSPVALSYLLLRCTSQGLFSLHLLRLFRDTCPFEESEIGGSDKALRNAYLVSSLLNISEPLHHTQI